MDGINADCNTDKCMNGLNVRMDKMFEWKECMNGMNA